MMILNLLYPTQVQTIVWANDIKALVFVPPGRKKIASTLSSKNVIENETFYNFRIYGTCTYINTIKIIFAPFVVSLHDNSSFCSAGTEILGTKRNYKYFANPASCADLTVIF